ncbi:MarR family transcriptional regulator [Kribbella sindirgiensis]|uniref:MarR family transcriptional regulator n=1 Tax=Kribbella sindirgiensis TaxID=1124744 RepID=A0A4R0JC64_9ACTN|nr:helix-turn-helix domain-containing protein [Kribbella sindirgiensis]TCC43044.1 MarR family transcriptional regulator [Kribbella sindirgiensis]
MENTLLEHLRFAPLTRAELVRRTRTSSQRVQVALDTLVREKFVVRRLQDDGPEDYELTEAGAGRLDVILDLTHEPLKTMGKVFAATVAETIRPRYSPTADPREVRRAGLGLIGWMLLPVLVVGLIVGGSIASGHLSTAVLFVLVAAGAVAWKFRGSGRRSAAVAAQPRPQPRPEPAATFAASPERTDRELVVSLAKIFGVGLVFAGVIIATNPSMVLLLVLLVVTGGNMFKAYRDWAKKGRSQ